MKRLCKRYSNELVIGQNFRIEELEDAMLGGFDGGDVAGQALHGGAKFFAGLAEQPPLLGVIFRILCAGL